MLDIKTRQYLEFNEKCYFSFIKKKLIPINDSQLSRTKFFNEACTVVYSNHNIHKSSSTFISPSYTFSLAGNIIVYMPNQGTNREITIIIRTIKRKKPNLAANKHLSIHFFPHGLRLFNILTEIVRAYSVRNGHQNVYSRVDALKIIIHKR